MNEQPIRTVATARSTARWHAVLLATVVLAGGILNTSIVRAQAIAADAANRDMSSLSTIRNPFVANAPTEAPRGDVLPAAFEADAEPPEVETAEDSARGDDAALVDPVADEPSVTELPADAAPAPQELIAEEPQPADALADALVERNADPAPAAEPSDGGAAPIELPGGIGGPEQWFSPDGISSAVQILLLMAVVSLAPAILLMTTCFVRIVVVLGLLRQAIGAQHLPPNQVMTSIALFMTLLIMTPVWSRVYDEAIKPYAAEEMTLEEAWDAGVKPVRRFMSAQIDRTGNRDDVWLFYKYLPEGTESPSSYDDVPLSVLLPAFMLSELKTAFLIGFQIYLPFLVLDLVVSSVTISMGMLMLPPTLVSLPLKLLLFVLVDGWHLVVGMLLESFQPFS